VLVRRLVALAVLSATPILSARAQSAEDSVGWHFVGAAGYVRTSGNADLSTANLSDRLVYRPSLRWAFLQTAAWVYGETGGTESANQLLGRLRSDYSFAPKLAVYALAGYERNRFAGITSRYEEGVGLAWKAVRAPRHEVDIEVGAGLNQQRNIDSTSDDFGVGRLAGRYRFIISDKAYAEEAAELLSNLNNTGDERVSSLTSLVAPLTSRIAIRVSYLLRYDAEPAIDPATSGPFKKLDTTFTTGIQLTL
jgi:putative salt-induced outer membrane protein